MPPPPARHAGRGAGMAIMAAWVAIMAACLPMGHGARAQGWDNAGWGNAGWPGALSPSMPGVMHPQAATGAQAWQGTLAHMRTAHDAARATWSADAHAAAAARRDMNRPTPGRDAPDNTDMPDRTPDHSPDRTSDAAAMGHDRDSRDPYAQDWARFTNEEAHLRQQMRHTP